MSIVTRGDIIIITVPISFSKQDARRDDWDELKLQLISGMDEECVKQLKIVEDKIAHEDEVRERTRPR